MWKGSRVGNAPLKLNTIYGSFDDELHRAMAPGMIIAIYFFLAATLTSTALIGDRLEGIWNRMLLANVDPFEVLLSHTITSLFIMLLLSVEFIIVSEYIYKLENRGSGWIVILMVFMIGLTAILYGLAVSILSKDFMTAVFASTLIFYPMMIMCGKF